MGFPLGSYGVSAVSMILLCMGFLWDVHDISFGFL